LKSFSVKKAVYSDIGFIFKLYNDGVKSGFFKNKKTIRYKQHERWYKLAIKSPIVFIHLFKKNNIPIGYIKFSLIKKQYAIISIIINKKFRKKGVASTLMKRSIKIIYKKYKIKKFYAEVLKKNLLSRNFFIKNSFIKAEYPKKNTAFKKNNDLFLLSLANL
jgi:RimJ/RimL family protein N-acetyltransferase